MTPDALAALHAAAFATPRPWNAREFAELLNRPTTLLVAEPKGFALLDICPPEAELLTLAVGPDHRKCGIGSGLMRKAIGIARAKGARRMILEVAADNTAALALYASCGFEQAGRRRGYYRGSDGARIDAIVLTLASLDPKTGPAPPESG